MTDRHLIRKAIDWLNLTLGLNARGNEQDWAVELADASRIGEFCAFYRGAELGSEERIALMLLIIASYDDYLRSHFPDDRDPELHKQVFSLLSKDFTLLESVINYWCQDDVVEEEADWDDPQWHFAVTPLLRDLRKTVTNQG